MPATRSTPALPTPAGSDYRHRLLEGMAHAVAAKGYGDTTITDIVREAAVSRRTFYEHFETKAACLIALYEAASHQGLAVLRQAVDSGLPWQAQADKALQAYLGAMAENPVLMRTLFIEILHLGDEGLAARRRVHEDIAQFIRDIINTPARQAPPLPREMALAVVGAVHELVLESIERGRAARIAELAPVVADLVRRIAGEPGPKPRATARRK